MCRDQIAKFAEQYRKSEFAQDVDKYINSTFKNDRTQNELLVGLNVIVFELTKRCNSYTEHCTQFLLIKKANYL